MERNLASQLIFEKHFYVFINKLQSSHKLQQQSVYNFMFWREISAFLFVICLLFRNTRGRPFEAQNHPRVQFLLFRLFPNIESVKQTEFQVSSHIKNGRNFKIIFKFNGRNFKAYSKIIHFWNKLLVRLRYFLFVQIFYSTESRCKNGCTFGGKFSRTFCFYFILICCSTIYSWNWK